MTIDWSTYTTIEQLENDIKSIKIQGATNVALATIRGMELVVSEFKADPSQLIDNVITVGNRLAQCRTNEPLARNAVKYLETKYKTGLSSTTVDEISKSVSQINANYLSLIEEGKANIVSFYKEVGDVSNVFTHCHSSTVEKLIIKLSENNPDFKVACAETRPLFQGRITAKNLNEAGLDTTLVVDSGTSGFVADRSIFPIDVAFIGADEITIHGDVINKIGSFGVSLGAYFSSTPVYVVASLLKMNPATAYKPVQIEMRNPYEVWENPPEGVKIYNPSFELVPNKLITGYITEVGIIKPEDMARKLHETFDWVF